MSQFDHDSIQHSLYVVLDDYSMLPLVEAYEQPHRKYHTLEHIQYILAAIAEVQERFSLSSVDVRRLHLLAWYHDSVYEIGKPRAYNEEASAAWYKRDFYDLHPEKTWAMEKETNLMVDAIVDTIDHNNPSSWISAIFMDLDLQGLGTPWRIYRENTRKIREEFAQYNDEEFRAGRIMFLKERLERNTVFHTAWGAEFEPKAQQNMARELYLYENEGAI